MVEGNKVFSLQEVMKLSGSNSAIMRLGSMISSNSNKLKYYKGSDILKVAYQVLEDDVWVKGVISRSQLQDFISREKDIKPEQEYFLIFRDGYELIAGLKGEMYYGKR